MQNEIDAEEAEMDKDADERQRKGGKRGKAGKKAEEDEQRERERELELRRRKIRKKYATFSKHVIVSSRDVSQRLRTKIIRENVYSDQRCEIPQRISIGSFS